VEHAVSRAALLLALAMLSCSPRRHIDLEFTADPTTQAELNSIVRVDVQVYDGDNCVCSDLDGKPGCMAADAVATLSFDPQRPNQSHASFPDGNLVIRVTASDASNNAIGLKVACWCVPDRSDLACVFPVGQPNVPAGTGCK
jgi:hypothetical protein